MKQEAKEQRAEQKLKELNEKDPVTILDDSIAFDPRGIEKLIKKMEDEKD